MTKRNMFYNLAFPAGFTLIELMVVVAIIGILAAIAIPNYIAFRNKSFCTWAESDAKAITGRIADYFAVPNRTMINAGSGLADSDIIHTSQNSWTVQTTDPNLNITISVTDSSGRCPVGYQQAFPSTGTRDGWNGASPGRYLKRIRI